jgi:hypothetical protein
VTTFVAVRSCGVLVSEGSNALCAGRLNMIVIDMTVAAAYATHDGASTNSVTEVTPIAMPCTR